MRRFGIAGRVRLRALSVTRIDAHRFNNFCLAFQYVPPCGTTITVSSPSWWIDCTTTISR